MLLDTNDNAFIMIYTIPTEMHFYICRCLISNVIKPFFLQLLTEIRSTTLRTVVSKKEKPDIICKILMNKQELLVRHYNKWLMI